MVELEQKTLDWRTQYRALFQGPPDPRIVVALFEDSTESLVSWPPDRQWHGNFNEFLSLTGVAVVTWDVILDLSREGEGDAAMGAGTQAAAERGTKVVVAAATSTDPAEITPGPEGPTQPITRIEGPLDRLYGDAHALIPFPQLRAVARYGFADVQRTKSGIVREVPMVVRIGDRVYPSLSLQTLMAFLGVSADQVRVRLGDAVYLEGGARQWRIPISVEGKYWVNFRYDQTADGSADFPTYSYAHLLLRINDHLVEKTPGAPAPPDLAGKIVFVGQTVTGKADAGPTQLNPYSPLVLVHANVINNVLTADFVRSSPAWLVALCAALLGYVALALSAPRSVVFMASITAFGVVAYIAASFGGWLVASLWLPLAWPLLGFGGLQFYVIGRRVILEQRAKQEIKGMFGTYVSPQLVEQMIASHQSPKLGGHAAEITAFFSDIEGFSTFSEKLTPDRLVELMNEYLTACTDVVQEEGGTLDKYVGDAIIAMFGAPIAQPDHALRACVASCRVQRRVAELRAKWTAEGDKWPEVIRRTRTRVGLNSGRCIIGNMGSRTRFNYTMMGDDVNLAARMESGAKSWGVYNMCTEATRLACEEHGKGRVVFRPLGRIVVKGRSQAVPIHEMVGLREAITPDVFEGLELFAGAVERFYARDWDAAIREFRRSAAREVNQPGKGSGIKDNPSLIFSRLAERFRETPPPPDWDGVHVMQEK